MLPYLTENFGNAHSLHSAGGAAIAAVERAREQVAEFIGADAPDEILFTSGATESNNWILQAFPEMAISPVEHSSLYEPAKARNHRILENNHLQIIVPEQLSQVSVMKVNNELGTIFQPEKLAKPGRIVHSDITQALGKVPVSVKSLDFASFSAHKFYGPKGVGALYAKGARFPEPLLEGGDQEFGARAGTLNVAGIVGMGAAAAIAQEEMEQDAQNATDMRNIVLESLNKKLDFQINGGELVSPYVLCVSFYGIEGESMVIELDRQGFAISSGAACSSRSVEPSHVLTALGMETEWLRGTIRISLGRFNTKEAASQLSRALSLTAETINSLKV
jgi:cysteine desulfurase